MEEPSTPAGATSKQDPLLALRGSGKELWADEHADDYVRRLRDGWEPAGLEPSTIRMIK